MKGITSVPNFMKIYQAFQMLLVGKKDRQHRYTDRQTGDMISLLIFLESRLNTVFTTHFTIPKNECKVQNKSPILMKDSLNMFKFYGRMVFICASFLNLGAGVAQAV
jgi:hypothetical protein